jgi:phage shock protein E
MGFIELIFGKKVDLKEVISGGAVILDVRTKGEYQSGHLRNSLNIPLDNLQSNLKKLKKNRAIVTCCASGARSGAARRILKSNGFTDVHNGGSWQSLKKFL